MKAMHEHKGFILRHKKQVTEISELGADGVPRWVVDTLDTIGDQNGFFAYGFEGEQLFDELEDLIKAIDLHATADSDGQLPLF